MNFNTISIASPIVWTNDDEDGGELYVDDDSMCSVVRDYVVRDIDIEECVVRKIQVKNILVKSTNGKWFANPYVGCPAGCANCIGRHMREYTKHKEPWGSFVDVKYWTPIVEDVAANECITISSITDPYNTYERTYKRTRALLEEFLSIGHRCIEIRTKSDLVLRDVDLLRQFDCVVAVCDDSALCTSLRNEGIDVKAITLHPVHHFHI